MEVIHPELFGWVLKKFGIYDFYKQKAENNARNQSGRFK